MIVAGIFLPLIYCSVIVSASIYGTEINGDEEWWLSNIFLKFYSPSGRNYYIDYRSGEIILESLEPSLENLKENVKENLQSPYISFLSLNFKIYDIYFETKEFNYLPRIEERKIVYEDKTTFIRHSLHSFVGPNSQIYRLSYNNVSDISIAIESDKQLNHLQINTYGAYSKWEHTYIFSNTGDLVTDLYLSPVKTLPNRIVPLPEMEPDILKDRNLLLLNFNTPSGNKYLITKDLNIASVASDGDRKNQNEPYIYFIEPNGKKYGIHFGSDDLPHIVSAPAEENDQVEDEYENGSQDIRLLSFVGPNRKLFRIDHSNATGRDVPVIESSANQSSDVQITILVTGKYYRRYIKFIFSGEGKELFDRVEELDSTPLSEQPELELDEVESNSEIAISSFLTFYSPSGKNYYISPNETTANIAAAKGKNNAQPSYISFLLQNGKRNNIYLSPGDHPFMETDPAYLSNSTTTLSLRSFVTPDKRLYEMGWEVENEIKIPFIDLTFQPKDPLDEQIVETLKITVVSSSRQYNYFFTWTGDKLVDAYTIPLKRISPTLVKSLIG